jgi:hypothetical protein
MDRDDEYQRNAQHCQRMADATTNASHKNEWLRLARSWLQMIRRGDPTATRAFDAEHIERGTGQEESNSSH